MTVWLDRFPFSSQEVTDHCWRLQLLHRVTSVETFAGYQGMLVTVCALFIHGDIRDVVAFLTIVGSEVMNTAAEILKHNLILLELVF